jgi:rRNA biogenesis protein RRP5
MSIQPLAIVVSLPNQLFAHVPITQITSQLTERLESTTDAEDGELDDDQSESSTQFPSLTSLFYVGQYVRAVVISTHAPGTTDVAGLGRIRDDTIKASRRVELSLLPEKVNTGVRKVDLKVGYVSLFQRQNRRDTYCTSQSLSAAVKSVEDHGYILELGVSGISGFLSFREAQKGGSEGSRLQVGALINVSVIKMSSNGRICTLTNDPDVFVSSSVRFVINPYRRRSLIPLRYLK